MEIEFDPSKDEINRRKHGISLARASDLDVIAFVDDSYLYDEPRYRLYGLIDGRPHVLAAVDRGDVVRAISLRVATGKEVKRHGL